MSPTPTTSPSGTRQSAIRCRAIGAAHRPRGGASSLYRFRTDKRDKLGQLLVSIYTKTTQVTNVTTPRPIGRSPTIARLQPTCRLTPTTWPRQRHGRALSPTPLTSPGVHASTPPATSTATVSPDLFLSSLESLYLYSCSHLFRSSRPSPLLRTWSMLGTAAEALSARLQYRLAAGSAMIGCPFRRIAPLRTPNVRPSLITARSAAGARSTERRGRTGKPQNRITARSAAGARLAGGGAGQKSIENG